MDRIKIIIADDHKVLVEGLLALFEDSDEIEIVKTVENGDELMEAYKKLCPDVILVDIKMPEINGLDAVRALKRMFPDLKALFLSMYEGDEYIYKVARAGGSGFINKNTSKRVLINAIKKVFNGETYFTGKWEGNSARNVIRRYTKQEGRIDRSIINLNFREKQILFLLNENMTSQQMADKMFISKKTVDFYRGQLKKKLRLSSNPELIKYAQKYLNENNKV